jgi:hypothetical protein
MILFFLGIEKRGQEYQLTVCSIWEVMSELNRGIILAQANRDVSE